MNEATDFSPDAASPSEWFYVDAQRQQQGPLSADALVTQVQGNRLSVDTLVWKDGMSDWQPLKTIPGLLPAGLLAAATVPPSQMAGLAADAPIDSFDIVYAGFWRRVAANVIDSFVMGMLSYVILIPVMLVAGLSLGALGGNIPAEQEDTFGLVLLLTYPLLYTLQAIYFGWMQSRPAQASLGKMACGIKVVGNNGERISFWRGFWRYFAFMFVGFFTLGIGLVMAAFTDRKRGLHDMVCNTLVVDKWAYTQQPQMQTRGLDIVTKVVLGIYAALIVLTFLFMMLVIMIAIAGQA